MSCPMHGFRPYYTEPCAATLAVTYSSGSGNERMITTTDLHNGCALVRAPTFPHHFTAVPSYFRARASTRTPCMFLFLIYFNALPHSVTPPPTHTHTHHTHHTPPLGMASR